MKVALRAIDHVIARLGTPDELPLHEERIGALRRWCTTPAALGEGECRDAVVGLVVAHALRPPVPPLQ